MNMNGIALHAKDIVLEDHQHISKNTGNISYEQMLWDDGDTGMIVKLVRYPKGCVTPLHDHHCGHGLYVLKGMLHTDIGDFEPGSFVWFKEGATMTHGGKDEDVECLFITNKAFDIRYLQRD